MVFALRCMFSHFLLVWGQYLFCWGFSHSVDDISEQNLIINLWISLTKKFLWYNVDASVIMQCCANNWILIDLLMSSIS